MDNENFRQLTFNTSGTACAVVTNGNTIDKVYIEERLTNTSGDNIPLLALNEIASGECIANMGITSNDDFAGNEWAVLTKFFSVFSGSTNKEDSQIVTHQESHYLSSLSAILNSGIEESHVFCFSEPAADSEYGKPHESIFLINPKAGDCLISFRQVLGANVPVKKNVKWPDSYYNRKTFSVCNAFECIREFVQCSTLKELYAVGQLGEDDKMIPSILSKCGAHTSQFKLEGKKQIFNSYEYVNSKEYDGKTKRDIALNLIYRLQKDYEKYLIDAVDEYFGSQERDVLSKSKNLILTGKLSDNVRANYLLLKTLSDEHTLYVDPISNEVSSAMGLAYELVGSCEIEPKGVDNFYLGRQLDPNNYSLLEHEDEKTVTPKEVAELIADGNIVAIAQGRSEVTDHALGNRSILADPRTVESKEMLSRSKYQPEHIPVIASVLEERAKDWFDMDKLNSIPEAMFAVDALDVAKEKAQGAVYKDGSTRVQTVNPKYNQNYYNLIKEFGDLTGVPMLLNTSLNMHTYPMIDDMKSIMGFMRCSGVNYIYLPETGKLLFVPAESPKS